MRYCILTSPDSWYFKDLLRAAEGSHELACVPFRQLASSAGPEGMHFRSAGVPLGDHDAIMVRTMPAGSLEQIVFRMDVLGRLEAAGTLVVNPPRAIETAVDKYLATARLQGAGLLVPRTCACQTIEEAMAAFESLGKDVVLKPLFGAEGRGITRIHDEALMLRAATLLIQLGAIVYVQEYVPHDGFDFRLLLLGERILGIRRINHQDWRTNMSRGASAEPLEITGELAEAGRRAAEAVGALVAGVDLLPARDGRLYALEVNAVPGWKAVAETLRIDVARLLLDYVTALVRREGCARVPKEN